MNEPQSIFIIDDSKGQIAKEAVSKIKEELEKQGNLVVVLSDATIIKNTIQTEPQLSAEMEAKFDDLVENKLFQGKDAEGYLDVYEYIEDDLPKLEQFIATALEEQRAKVLSEVEGWLADEDSFEISKSCIDDGNVFSGSLFLRIEAQNNLRAGLRTKLNQLKGNHD